MLVRAAVGAAPEEQERGLALAAEGEEVAKSVSAETTTRSSPRARPAISPSPAVETVVANMRGVVAGGREALGDAR